MGMAVSCATALIPGILPVGLFIDNIWKCSLQQICMLFLYKISENRGTYSLEH